MEGGVKKACPIPAIDKSIPPDLKTLGVIVMNASVWLLHA